jgi:sugar lactone lactonase YvrE
MISPERRLTASVRRCWQLAISLFLLASARGFGQEDFFFPNLEWRTIETEHFFVHYHDGTERTARVVAKIAEEIFDPITSLYNHQPDQKVSFIIRDHDDISNGAAYFFDNKIEIYASSMDYELRGTHNWLRNVITHEFTHIVQIQTSMKYGRKMPAVYLQWLNYESERRPDVLYGYPNVVVSYPISGFVVPAWFAEGVAQFNRKELRYDFWDSHRDMILRSYALDGNMLTWEQMGVFGKTSLGNESSYNAGFAFVSYLARTYGDEALAEISRSLSSFTEFTIDGAIERAVGKSGRKVYDEWCDVVKKEYTARIAPVRTRMREGERLRFDSAGDVEVPGEGGNIQVMARRRGPVQLAPPSPCCQASAATGFANLYPAYSPDGKKVAYTSTKGADYFGLSALFVYDFEKKQETLIQPRVRTAPAWSPDGKILYYAKMTRSNPHWELQFDLYAYDLTKEEEKRLTNGKRAISPTVSPDGSRIAFVVNADGTTNLAVAKIDGSDFRLITPYVNGEQVYSPQWSPDGERIVFDYSVRDGRDIAMVRPDGTELTYLITGEDDSRSAVFTRDGSKLIFSSDRTGIFNLYSYALGQGTIEQVTNVVGGAFLPTVSSTGDIIYAGYTSGGYKLFQLPGPLTGVTPGADYVQNGIPNPPAETGSAPLASRGAAPYNWDALRSYDDTRLPPLNSRPYKSMFSSLTFVPFLRVDNYNPKSRGIDLLKPGLYVFSNDLLDRTSIFAGGAMNLKMERDLYLQFSYRGKIPLLYSLGLEPVATAEIFNVTRKGTPGSIGLGSDTIAIDVDYSLLEFDLALNEKFISQFSEVEFRYAHSRYTSILGSFVLPEAGLLVPASSDLYLIANDLSLTFKVDAIVPSTTSDINPVGRKIRLRVDRELNKFSNGEYEYGPTGLQPKYDNINFTRLELNWKEHLPMPFRKHTLTATLRGGTILGPAVDDFFDFYAGGLIGMKGYPFYAIGGNELAAVGLDYRFPLIDNIDVRFLPLYFDKLYASVYADLGNAWTGTSPSLKDFKKDLGVQLRLESFSFYSYPTRIFFDATYGFDRFDRYVRSVNQTVTYGKEWRFYFGIMFGFDFD